MKNGDRVKLSESGRRFYVHKREKDRRGTITCAQLPNRQMANMVLVLWDGLRYAQTWPRSDLEAAA